MIQRCILYSALILVFAALLTGCGEKASVPESEETREQDMENAQNIEKMNRTAEALYLHTRDGNMELALNELERLENEMTQVRFSGITKIEGLEALTDTVVRAKREFHSVKFSRHKGLLEAAKIRLAVDALNHAKEPMWLQYYKVIKEDIGKIGSAAADKNGELTLSAFQRLHERYQIIRPSALITRDVAVVTQADSFFTYLKKKLEQNPIDFKSLDSDVVQLHGVIGLLFQKKNEPAYVPVIDQRQPIYWTFGIGSTIVLVLTFVGWRKFRYGNDYVALPRDKDYKGW
jgi:sporulation protein YpjB